MDSSATLPQAPAQQQSWPTPISRQVRTRVLAAYRGALPENEWAALRAWLHTFYPFQLEWVLDPSRFSVCNKSRQIGMSHSTAGVVVQWAAFQAETTTLISIGQREADEVLDKAEKHAKALVLLGSNWARTSRSGEQLKFASGGRIIALPASSGGRGFSGNMFLDEYAYLEKPEVIWDAASAVTMHGGKFRVASTPNGVGNSFHGFWTKPKQNAGWTKHEFPLDRAIAEGMNVSLDDCWKMAKGNPRLFDQLFRLSFLDGEQQYIPTELVDVCSVEDAYCFEGDTYGGLDIGRSNDKTVLYVVRKDNAGVRWVQAVERRKRTSVDDLNEIVAWAFQTHGVRRLVVDATGMGTFPAETFQKRWGRTRVEPFVFTQNSKEDLATGLYQAFADQTVRIPRDDDELRNDVCSLRRIITAAGNVRYDAPRTDEGHGDSAWALALALHACSGPDRTRHEVD